MAPPKPPAGLGAGPTSGEDAFIERIRAVLAARLGPSPPGELWIGDDAALLAAPRGDLLLTADAVVAGIHADLALVGLDDLGWKALNVAVSDVAAMGGRALCALVSACLPTGTDTEALIAGLAEAAAACRCPIVGGDLTGAGQVVLSVAVTGTTGEEPPPPVRRSGASPDHQLFVTGPLGASAGGLRRLRAAASGRVALEPSDPLVRAHRRPVARLDEGWVARLSGARAMIDVSDGLSLDLHRLADASGIGFHLEQVPVAEGATMEEALGGGEDYELIIATPDPAGLCDAFARAGLRNPVRLGECLADPAVRVLGDAPLARSGWEHPIGC